MPQPDYTYDSRISNAESIISEKSNETRYVSYGLVPNKVKVEIRKGNIEIKFEYPVSEESQEKEQILEDSSIWIYRGKFTKKFIKVVLNSLNTDSLAKSFEILIIHIGSIVDLTEQKVIKKNYSFTLTILENIKDELLIMLKDKW